MSTMSNERNTNESERHNTTEPTAAPREIKQVEFNRRPEESKQHELSKLVNEQEHNGKSGSNEPSNDSELSEQAFLQQYRAEQYERPSVATDMVIFTVTEAEENNYRKLPEKELRLLLIQRGGHPFKGQWALPGGFVQPNETTEQCAARELVEETGLSDVYLEQLYTFSDIGRDPRAWVMSCSYMALVNSEHLQLKAGDDAARAEWFKVSYRLIGEHDEHGKHGELDKLSGVGELGKLGGIGGIGDHHNSGHSNKPDDPSANVQTGIRTRQYELTLTTEEETLTAIIEQTMTTSALLTAAATAASSYTIRTNHGLAFDHAKIIAYAIDRLRGKINYSDLALHLVPELFTLTELQQVYEVILDKELLKAAFRRKVTDLVAETDHFTENAGHRPSRLFRRRGEE